MPEWVGVCIVKTRAADVFMFRFNIHLLIFRLHAFGGTLNTHRYKHTHRFILSVVIYSALIWWTCVSVLVYSREFFFLKYLPMFFFSADILYIISYTNGKKRTASKRSMLLFQVINQWTWSQSKSHHAIFIQFFLLCQYGKYAHENCFMKIKSFQKIDMSIRFRRRFFPYISHFY